MYPGAVKELIYGTLVGGTGIEPIEHRPFGSRVGASKLWGVKFTAAITREENWFVARCLEVDVASQGRTVEDAQANLQEALELLYEDQPLPTEIEPPIIATLELSA